MAPRYDQAYAALSAVVDPELDEPITDLGFVRSLVVTPAGNVKCHLRLPTSFCSPNFAYLMASDAKDVLSALDWTRDVVVELDDHHDSAIINAGLAATPGIGARSVTRRRRASTSCGRRSGARPTPRRWSAA